MQGFNAEYLQEKWAPILNHEGLGGINDAHKRMVTAVLRRTKKKQFVRSVSSFRKLLPPTQYLVLELQTSIPF